MICEICGRPIDPDEDYYYIDFPVDIDRGAHCKCIRKRIVEAFGDCVGTQDDSVGELIANSIESGWGMMGITPEKEDAE